ncbi:hypothetical protein OIU79_006445, partial [Salix purpurea]
MFKLDLEADNISFNYFLGQSKTYHLFAFVIGFVSKLLGRFRIIFSFLHIVKGQNISIHIPILFPC